MRSRDTLARIGGDEFSLLLENCPLDNALQVAEATGALVRDFRFVWQGRSFSVGVSIGIAPIVEQVGSTAELLAQADMACYTAKDLGRNRVHLYQRDDSETAKRHRELHLAAEISDAIKQNRFLLYAQPIHALAGADRQFVKYEILTLPAMEVRSTRRVVPGRRRYGRIFAVAEGFFP